MSIEKLCRAVVKDRGERFELIQIKPYDTVEVIINFSGFRNRFFATHATKKKVMKNVRYYLATSEESEDTTTQTLDDKKKLFLDK
jgi:hypothetical protein